MSVYLSARGAKTAPNAGLDRKKNSVEPQDKTLVQDIPRHSRDSLTTARSIGNWERAVRRGSVQGSSRTNHGDHLVLHRLVRGDRRGEQIPRRVGSLEVSAIRRQTELESPCRTQISVHPGLCVVYLVGDVSKLIHQSMVIGIAQSLEMTYG